MHNRLHHKVLGTIALMPMLALLAPAAIAAQPAMQSGVVAKAVPKNARQRSDVKQEVTNALAVVKKMKADPKLASLMKRAKGMFIVPEFGRGALGVGIRGGSGLMVANNNGVWSAPVFYNMGGISIGAQAGASGGSIAFLLMTPKAVQKFYNRNSFSLNADAGLSIVNYSANAQASLGKGDVILWSDTKGLFAGVEISATDITLDGQADRAYYAKSITPKNVLTGVVNSPKSDLLEAALAR